MTDRELLEAAARAEGVSGSWQDGPFPGVIGLEIGGPDVPWNPLRNAGQALQLAARLGLSVEPYPLYDMPKHSVVVKQRRRTDLTRTSNPTEVVEVFGEDRMAAVCRAIVRAAASLATRVPA